MFGGSNIQVARKPHRCMCCGQTIPAGMRYSRIKGKWEGEWQNWAAHEVCLRIYHKLFPNEEVPEVDGWRQSLEDAEKAGELAAFLEVYRLPTREDLDDDEVTEIEGFKARAGLAAQAVG